MTYLVQKDEVVIFSKNICQRVKDIDKVLTVLYRTGVILVPLNSHFYPKKIEYLGHIVLSVCLSAALKNVEAIKTAAFLTDSTQMRLVLGGCIVYKRFRKDFSKISRPRNDNLRKDEELDWSQPTTEAQDALNKLKSKSIEPPVLALLQPHRPYMTNTNASANEF